jgi:hypothetical protein
MIDLGVEEGQFLVEDKEGQGQDHRRQDQLAEEEERDVGVLHPQEFVAEPRQPVSGEAAQSHRQHR